MCVCVCLVERIALKSDEIIAFSGPKERRMGANGSEDALIEGGEASYVLCLKSVEFRGATGSG